MARRLESCGAIKKGHLSLEMPGLSRIPAHDRIRKAQKLPARSNSNMNKKNAEN